MAAERIEEAVAAMGAGALSATTLSRHVRPLFSRVLREQAGKIYLANHSLGRPLDATADDVAEALALWPTRMGRAWDDWSLELRAFRERLARLLGAPRPDCIVPKTSAGQGLRAILNTYDHAAQVVATRGEFDSIDVILRHYAQRGRISLRFVEPGEGGTFAAADVRAAVRAGTDLVVLSQVMFNSGQVLPELGALVDDAHGAGARVLLDVYHSLGALPVDVAALDVDFAVGGSYKYLRGGPGSCFLYLHPRHLDGNVSTLDVGWFAKRDAFDYRRPDPPRWAEGGDAFMESTPPVLTWYQARAGQRLALALGAARVRQYTLAQQRGLVDWLAREGIAAAGGDEARGAFCVVDLAHRGEDAALRCARALDDEGVIVDARGRWLRLCPDILSTDDELARAAAALAQILAAPG
ncbi:MAG TPA: aminotransferase class V-fold PLP-dependent enzyme [Casimicrobiaceae bacterium]